LGHGSEFTVRLPLPSVAAPVPPTEAPDASAVQGMRVLIVEDNRDAANTLKRLLIHSGVNVELAFSGTEGLEAARKGNADVVICDIGLPGLNGFDVARALRSDETLPNLYLIALSGYGQPEDVRQALDAGFNLHLIKPVDFSSLMQALKEVGSMRPSAADKA
jgi:CheY-like chemotaxis protein